MAPEVFRNEQYDHKVDMFSFAILSYELLARKRAYDSMLMTMESVARAVAFSQLRPPIPKKWPEELTDLFQRCWAQKPDQRPEFGDIINELKALVAKVQEMPPEGEKNELLEALSPASALSGCCVLQ